VWWKLQEDLATEAIKQLKDFERYAKSVHDENARRQRRSTAKPKVLTINRPVTWSLDRGFDPYYVRAKADTISHAVTHALRNGHYEPHRPAGFRVPKADGSQRLVSTFPIVDELISNRLYRSLLEKNRPRFSARAYAYRADLSAHDALMHVQSELAQEQRVFIAEYDFSKFFDRISHDHIWQTIDEMGLIRTKLEERLLQVFLKAPAAYETLQQKLEEAAPRAEGVPQGSSISLLLANIAAVPLDRALERLGVGFVRYADDTLIWSRDYAAICEAVQILHAEAANIGSPINLEKSNGVRILVPPDTRYVEFSSTATVEYLGHSIGLRSLTMKSTVVSKIKCHIQSLIFSNLVREPLSGTQASGRLRNGLDRDYVAFLWQLRRYLYGPLSEQQVRRFQHRQIPPMTFEGLMSFFPLVDDDAVLLDLDRWISTQTWLAIKKRSRLLNSLQLVEIPRAWQLSREELIGYRDISTTTGSDVDLRLPSVRRIASVVRKAVQIYGAGVVSGGRNLYMYET
jgi:RNA-directed DNA polymerase